MREQTKRNKLWNCLEEVFECTPLESELDDFLFALNREGLSLVQGGVILDSRKRNIPVEKGQVSMKRAVVKGGANLKSGALIRTPPTNMVSVVSERPRRSNHKEFAKELGKAVESTKKYPSCTAPIGEYCNKHGVIHTKKKRASK